MSTYFRETELLKRAFLRIFLQSLTLLYEVNYLPELPELLTQNGLTVNSLFQPV